MFKTLRFFLSNTWNLLFVILCSILYTSLILILFRSFILMPLTNKATDQQTDQSRNAASTSDVITTFHWWTFLVC